MAQYNPVRATALLGYRDLVQALGGEPDTLIRSVGINTEIVGQSDQFIRYEHLVELLELSAKVLEQPLFGLKFSETIPIESLGAVAAVARSAETVLQGVAEVARYIHHYSPAVYLTLSAADGVVTMVQDLHLRGTIPRQQVTDLKLGMAFKFPRYLADKAIKPVEVSIRHANKKHAKAYTKYFECPVKFAQTENKISFKLKDLEIPVKSSDAFLHELAEYHIGMETLGLYTDRVKQTRMLISRLLASNECTLQKVSAKLLLHERTLQRQLKTAGSSFQQLVDEVRKERALTYLDIPNMPIAKIAELLGFEEQSSFNKAFQRWRNERPSDYRRQHQNPLPS